MYTDHPFLAAKLCLHDHHHFSHIQPSSQAGSISSHSYPHYFSSRFVEPIIKHIFLLPFISTSLSGLFSFCHSGSDSSRLAPIFLGCFLDCVIRSFAPTNFFRVPGMNLFVPFFFFFLVSLLLLQHRWD